MSQKHRIIARLDIKGPNLIKGIHLEGLRVVGDPQSYANKYYQEGVDELIYIDSVASLYERNNLTDVLKRAAENIFIPMTVGGGIRSVSDVEKLLRSGADKIAINTAAVKNPNLIQDVSKSFGAQCMVLSIEAKKKQNGKWEVYFDNGREKTNIDVLDWVKKGVDLGAGEILLTSIDMEGTRRGFDLDLLKTIANTVPVPVIASGGMGQLKHAVDAIKIGNADAIAIADVLHYNRFSLKEIKSYMSANGIGMREL